MMTEEFFRDFIINKLNIDIAGLANFSARSCPDNIIGYYSYTQPASWRLWMSRSERLAHRQYIEAFADIRQSIVLIIESPHKAEFAAPQFIAPAMGPTGGNIANFLPALLRAVGDSLALTGKYTLVLMNTVQQQCSLGEVPRVYRDRVWRELWELEQADFIARLRSYRPAVLVEMCTASDGRKAKVRNVLRAEFPELPLFSTAHPAAWHYPNMRRLQRL